MEYFLEDNKNLVSTVNNKYQNLLEILNNLEEKDLNDLMISQLKYIIDDIKKLGENIEDLNNNIVFNNFNTNQNLKEKIEEKKIIDEIVADLIPFYILSSLQKNKNT